MPSQANHPLPPNTIVEEYRIIKQLASGGFSIVYLAHDPQGNAVAVKEYLPSSLALRTAGEIKPVISEENLQTFRYGMKSFFEEGRALATISHPNIVRVLNFFRANDTVYMVMQYERGRTLQQYILSRKTPMRETVIRQLFAQLLNGLREVHTGKLLHLDIKPANIYIRHDGSPLLLDFGAARQTLTGQSSKLAPMYTPGFASPEQYVDRENLGPWSDIYGIGASLYSCIAGTPPPAANLRLQQDRIKSASKVGAGKYSPRLLEIIEWCLQLDHLARPQSGFALQKALQELPSDPVPRSFFGNLVARFTSK